MSAVMDGGRVGNVIADSAVHVRMTDIVCDVVVHKTCQIGDSLLPLLLRLQMGEAVQGAPEKLIDMVLVHVGTHVSVIPVPQDGNIVKEHIRPLQTQLVEPAVFCNNVLELVVWKIIVGFHAKNIVSSKTWHSEKPSFFINSSRESGP